jgi:fumarylacetoacetate (FAA) hydrolase
MKLGSLKSSLSRDGQLCVVSRDLKRAVKVVDLDSSQYGKIPGTLRESIESWETTKPLLEKVANHLEVGKIEKVFDVDQSKFHSPLPRAFQWADGSAFLHHVKLGSHGSKG